MGMISFLFFQCKTALTINSCHVISNMSQLLPPVQIDDLEIANCSITALSCTVAGDFGQALLIRSCHEDVVSTRKSHNCAETAFVQGDSAGG